MFDWLRNYFFPVYTDCTICRGNGYVGELTVFGYKTCPGCNGSIRIKVTQPNALLKCSKVGHKVAIRPKIDKAWPHQYMSQDVYVCKRCGHRVVAHGWFELYAPTLKSS